LAACRSPALSQAQEELIGAKLDMAQKPSERVALLEEQLKLARGALEFAEKSHKSGLATANVYLRVKAHCLEIEIKLAKERAAMHG
jgi:outer membrane protein TolC